MNHRPDCNCDPCLLAQMQSSNPAERQRGWTAWYSRDAATLLRYTERRCQTLGCGEHSEDMLQDTFVIGFRNISTGHFTEQGKSLCAYLHGIARNVIYDVARLQRKETLYEAECDRPVEEIISPEDRIELENIMRLVAEAYQQLSSLCRSIINGLYAQEKTSQELSVELRKSAINIRAIARRAVLSIHAYLADSYGIHLSSDAIRLCLKML